MTAAEARELSKKRSEVLIEREKEIYDDVIAGIERAIEKDECWSITYYASLPVRVQNRLEADGYKLSYASYRNESQYNISWEEDIIV